jgi:hypothetical protein
MEEGKSNPARMDRTGRERARTYFDESYGGSTLPEALPADVDTVLSNLRGK